MMGKLRLALLFVFMAPLPVLVQMGLREEGGGVTATGAALSLAIALIGGTLLARTVLGILRMPLILLIISGLVLFWLAPSLKGL